MTRLLLIPVVLLLLLVLGAVLLVPVLLDKDKVLQLAADTLHEQTGATLTVDGDAKLSVFPKLGIAVSDAAIVLPQKQQADLNGGKVQIGTLHIGVQFLPLLRGRVEVDSIELDGLKASIVPGSGQSKADTSTLSDKDLDALYAIRRERMANSAQVTGPEAALLAPLALHVKQLTLTNARLELLDSGGAAPKVIELQRLEARDLNLDGAAIPLELSLHLPGKQAIDVHLKGDIRVDQQHQTATLAQLELTATGALAKPLQLRASGVIDLNRQSADLQLALESGETRGSGMLRYTSFQSPQIDTVLKLNQLDPALLALAGPDAIAAAGQESTAASGDQPLPLDTLRAIDARAVLNIDKARFGDHTVDNMQVSLLALDGLIQVTDLTGDLYGGKLKANGTLDGTHNAVTLDTNGSLTHLNIASALAAAKAKLALTGNASVNWQLHSQGRTANALTAGLQGPVKLTTEALVLKNVGVQKLLCQTVALSNKEPLTATFPADTHFSSLATDIQVAAGKAQFNPLRGGLTGVALSGSGNYNLLTKKFDATLKARLSPELELLDHACRISKRLTAIDLPVSCAGTVGTEPGTWCRVDATKIVQDLTVNEVREKLEKKAGKLFDKLFNKGN